MTPMVTTAKPSPAPQQTPCGKCPLRSLHVFREFQQDELDFVQWFKSGELHVEAGATILMEGTNSPHLYTVLAGWAFRYKSLEDGRRQILNFAMPGEFIGLQNSIFKEMQHSVEALTDTVLCVFPREKVWTLYNKHPSLAFDLTWLASRQESLLDENLLSVGRRSALERVAHLLLCIFYRAKQSGLAQGRRAKFPFTQQHVADALGLSLVHTNKTLRLLSDRRLINWKDGNFEICDEDKLKATAAYGTSEPPLRPFI